MTKSGSVQQTVTVELKRTGDGTRADDDSPARENLKGFTPLLVTAQVLGLLSLILLLYWISKHAAGLGFSMTNVFNWHPLLLSIGFIYLTGNGLLGFRILRNMPKPTLKLLHAGVQGLNCLLGFLGLWSAYDYHVKYRLPHFFTLHSWIGLLTAILFFAQAIGGTSAFLYPGFKANMRALLMPFHRFIGQALLALAIVSAISGLNEKAIYKLNLSYSELGSEAVLINFIGILFVSFATVVLYLASNLDYKRYPRPEDDEGVVHRSK